ncbi:MAG: hypothetical protein J1E39_08295 [Eubacterium sp.]|nr:hypothetical protein [Eubacterium sp.]
MGGETKRVTLSVLGKQLSHHKRLIMNYIRTRHQDFTPAADKSMHELCLDNKFLTALCSEDFGGCLPVIYSQLKDCADTDAVIRRLKTAGQTLPLGATDIEFIPQLIAAGRVQMLYRYAKAFEDKLFMAELNAFIYPAKLDTERIISSCSRLHTELWRSAAYRAVTPQTRHSYRTKLEMVSSAANIDELRLAMGYLTAEEKGEPLGRLIDEDFTRVFPPPPLKRYLSAVILSAVGGAAVVGLLSWSLTALLLIFPFYILSKNICDRIWMRAARQRSFIPAKNENDALIPDNAKTLCVISTLLTGEADIPDARRRAEEFLNKNRTDNLQVCLLCDLPQSKTMTADGDHAIYRALEKYAAAPAENVFFALRARTYSKTQKCWMGYERKRGATEQLAEMLLGGEGHFTIYGGQPARPKYLLALDYDTSVPIDGAAALVGYAEAVENRPVIRDGRVVKGYGIIAPSCVPKLSACMNSGFAAIFGGYGGSGFAQYGINGDFYMTVFGEGIFCGKGLINLDAYAECCRTLPENCILSHDILEGGLLRTAAVPDEFTEGFPADVSGYYKRLSRWQRGDIQNIPFIFSKLKLNRLDRYKLFDNAARVIAPIFTLACFFTFSWLVALSAAAAVILPFFPIVTRDNGGRFLSGVVGNRERLVYRALCELILIPKSGLSALGALLITICRMIRHKNMLCWTTAFEVSLSARGALKTVKTLLLPSAVSLPLLFFSPVSFGAAVLFLSQIPVFIALDAKRQPVSFTLGERQRKELLDVTAAELRYYLTYANVENNFLPPDNVQLEPAPAVAYRTSPTNIGMYMLSLLCCQLAGLLAEEEFVSRITAALDTIDVLRKYRGNLYNWYDTRTLEPLSDFVSSVDSGNFVCCLTALKQGVRSTHPNLYARIKTLCDNTRIDAFYKPESKLLAIGIDAKTEKQTDSCYDLLMSEARMTSFYGIAKGQLPISHRHALSGIKGRSSVYRGSLSWSGTCFEYFMPQLLLPAPRGSLIYENLRYAVHCQKKNTYKGLYGISESGFYAFDRQLNYQYRAFGVRDASMRPDFYFEPVYSPYSAFLMLPFDFYGCFNLLVKYRDMGCFNNRFGYYEAVDFSDERTDGGKTVKSFMAHHKGMSIIACANLLLDDIAVKLFMSDEDMKRGEEMSEERITGGGTLYKNRRPTIRPGEKVSRTANAEQDCGFFSNGRMTVAVFSPSQAGEGALTKSIWQGRSLFYPAVYGQYDRHDPKQSFTVRISENDRIYNVRGGTFTVNGGYKTEQRELTLSEKISLHPTAACELHEFYASNHADVERKLSLNIYLRPALGYDRAVTAHPAFSDMFLSCEYDENEKIITVCRRQRDSGEKTCMAIAFDNAQDLYCCFDRERADIEKPLSENILTCVPAPCVYVSLPFTLKKAESREIKMYICCAASVEAAKAAAKTVRTEEITEGLTLPEFSPLSRTIAFAMLPYLVFGGRNIKPDKKPTGTFAELWKYNIDTSRPAVCFTCADDGECLFSVLKAARRLINAGFDFTPVILCTDRYESIKAATERSFEFDGRVSVIDMPQMTENDLALLKYFCCYYAPAHQPVDRTAADNKKRQRLPLKVSHRIKLDEGFISGGYVINHTPAVPWSKPLANATFGALVHSDSLGFCWAKNSALNKLTPWDNELTGTANGIGLYVSHGGKYTDIVKNSTCVFRKNSAQYLSRSNGIVYEVTAAVPEKGMAEIIRVKAENNSDKDISLSALLVTKLSGRAVTEVTDGCVTARLLAPEGFHGRFSLYSKGAVYGTDYDKAMCENFEITPDGDCLAASAGLNIPAGQSRTAVFIISYASLHCSPAKLPAVLTMLAAEDKLKAGTDTDSIKYTTGSESLDALMNVWLPDQIIKGRIYARTGFYQNGGAFGFRDQLQDGMAAAYIDPSLLRHLILCSCRAQLEEGDVLHWYHVSEEGINGIRTACSDDMLWLPLAVCHYISLTNDSGIAVMPVQYSTAPEIQGKELYTRVGTGKTDTVINHCLNAAERAYRKGPHGLLLIGGGDWNDSFNAVGEKGQGESVWLSMFYCMVCDKLCGLPDGILSEHEKERYKTRAKELRDTINSAAYENGYYLRGFYDDGSKLGAQGEKYCEIDILSQAFAVLADINDKEHIDRSRSAINLALGKLADYDNGLIKLFTPPFSYSDENNKTGYVVAYPNGIRENGGQYTHAAVWLCMAVNKLGYPDEAKRLLSLLNPALKDEAVYKNEPYYMSADVYAHPDCYGRGGWSLYTGAAGWYYRAVRELFPPSGGNKKTP